MNRREFFNGLFVGSAAAVVAMPRVVKLEPACPVGALPQTQSASEYEKCKAAGDGPKDIGDPWAQVDEEIAKDFAFYEGEQWQPEVLKARQEMGRPCLTLNRVKDYIDRLAEERRIIKYSAEWRRLLRESLLDVRDPQRLLNYWHSALVEAHQGPMEGAPVADGIATVIQSLDKVFDA